MQFATWEPIYRSILDDFGFTLCKDEEAAELLRCLLKDRITPLIAAKEMLAGSSVVVCGNAPCLRWDLEQMHSKQERDAVFLAADGAVAVLQKLSILPAIVVTDLDGPFPAIQKANQMGSIVVVHAHGDNLDALQRYVPRLDRIIGTVQCLPPPGLYNFGGFTDGDRAIFLAIELGARKIVLKGFDFDDNSVTPRKKKKLAWAKRLIDMALLE